MGGVLVPLAALYHASPSAKKLAILVRLVWVYQHRYQLYTDLPTSSLSDIAGVWLRCISYLYFATVLYEQHSTLSMNQGAQGSNGRRNVMEVFGTEARTALL